MNFSQHISVYQFRTSLKKKNEFWENLVHFVKNNFHIYYRYLMNFWQLQVILLQSALSWMTLLRNAKEMCLKYQIVERKKTVIREWKLMFNLGRKVWRINYRPTCNQYKFFNNILEILNINDNLFVIMTKVYIVHTCNVISWF